MGWIPKTLYISEFSEVWVWLSISLYSSESREGWVGYLYPCIAQDLGKDGLDTYISMNSSESMKGWV